MEPVSIQPFVPVRSKMAALARQANQIKARLARNTMKRRPEARRRALTVGRNRIVTTAPNPSGTRKGSKPAWGFSAL